MDFWGEGVAMEMHTATKRERIRKRQRRLLCNPSDAGCELCENPLVITEAEAKESERGHWPEPVLTPGQLKEMYCQKCWNEICTDIIEAQSDRDLMHKEVSRYEEIIAKNHARIIMLEKALRSIDGDAFSCMEGAGDPAFSDYERISGTARNALKGDW